MRSRMSEMALYGEKIRRLKQETPLVLQHFQPFQVGQHVLGLGRPAAMRSRMSRQAARSLTMSSSVLDKIAPRA